jgi:aryl-alcohol dehydrogenase-like predicted oxidoreductase
MGGRPEDFPMVDVNRREFMKHSAGAVAASWALGAWAGAETAATPPPPCCAATPRPLGKTGITTSWLGMGTGTQAWNGSSAQNRKGREHFVNTLAHAYDRGLRYFDLADMYGAHDYMKEAMAQAKMDRAQLCLLTKTVAKDADGVRADLERFRKELDVDTLDVVLLHCMTEGGWDEKLAPCRDVLSEAKEKGVIRAHGVSCHNLDAMKTAASLPWVDIMLNRINPHGVKMDGTVEEVLAVLETAHANGKGMLGMKIYGEGELADKGAECLAYAKSLKCIDAMTIGFITKEDIDGTVDRFERA